MKCQKYEIKRSILDTAKQNIYFLKNTRLFWNKKLVVNSGDSQIVEFILNEFLENKIFKQEKKNYPVIRLDVYALQMEKKISYVIRTQNLWSFLRLTSFLSQSPRSARLMMLTYIHIYSIFR